MGELIDVFVPYYDNKVDYSLDKEYLEQYDKIRSGVKSKDMISRSLESQLFSIMTKAVKVTD